MTTKIVTVESPSNKAFINHWGKDPKTNRPDSPSLSATLEMKTLDGVPLRTKTSVVFSSDLKKDALYIDGKFVDLNTEESQERFRPVYALREAAGTEMPVLVVSNNDAPTASGVATSASGVSALTIASARALDLDLPVTELSKLARTGSGSASRSFYGGFILWERGEKEDGSDSFARQVFPPEHWRELVDVIAVVPTPMGRKAISSTKGMMMSRETSPLYQERLAYIPGALKGMLENIAARDFSSLAEKLMVESDNLHEVMRTTVPSIEYMTDQSRRIINGVVQFNKAAGGNRAAYTVGAGAIVHIITEHVSLADVHAMLDGIGGVDKRFSVGIGGSGPRILDDSESLIDPVTLRPKGIMV